MSLPRVVRPERLDALPPDDPAARRSRRDLVRVHLAMGTRGIVARGWRALLPEGERTAPVRILELGAGDGTLALAVARRLAPAWSNVELTLLDRQDIVAARTRAALDALGWRTTVEIADVLDWAADARAASETWDLVVAALFLHHFEGEALAALLRAVAVRAGACFAFEPRRDQVALLGSRLVGALGANAVTRTDAVLSVHAGFQGEELSAAWPGASDVWRLEERVAGPFGHAFAAHRQGALA